MGGRAGQNILSQVGLIPVRAAVGLSRIGPAKLLNLVLTIGEAVVVAAALNKVAPAMLVVGFGVRIMQTASKIVILRSL